MKINYFSMAIIPTFKSIQMMAFINYSANVVSHFQPPYYCMSMPTIVMTFLVRECYGSPKKQEF
jgi:tellurite resistance protein TehA-like permease